MKKFFLFFFSIFLILAASIVFLGYKHIMHFGDSKLQLTTNEEFKIPAGSSYLQIGKSLEKRQLLTSKYSGFDIDWFHLKWRLFGRLYPQKTALKAGVYELTTGETVNSMLDKFVTGKEKSFSLTLVDGQTIKEWQPQLLKAPHLVQSLTPFLTVLAEQGDISGTPEGKFFPDTYHYHAGMPLTKLLTQSYLKMQDELNDAWENRDQSIPLKTPYELLIMASIIEKETAQASERSLIAAVFMNRLRKKMRLQTDPTVIYGMGDRFDGNITRADLREATPFNTYTISGLPPTPIAAPGKEALIAAAHPADVSYLYFVSRNDGSHVFSNTLKEHNNAVNKYQRNL